MVHTKIPFYLLQDVYRLLALPLEQPHTASPKPRPFSDPRELSIYVFGLMAIQSEPGTQKRKKVFH